MKAQTLTSYIIISILLCKMVMLSSMVFADTADVVYHSGKIYTVDDNDSWAEAVAIRDGKFIKVGSNNDVKSLSSNNTKVINLDGKMAMPGIFDLHTHPFEGGIMALYECQIEPSTSLERMANTTAECARETPADEWIRGSSWPSELRETGPRPHKSILDAVIRDKPVFIVDTSWHGAWLNSKALSVLGIDKNTPDPEGGIIEKDPETGEPTGLFLDEGLYFVMHKLPQRTPQQFDDALLWAVAYLNSVGVTGMMDSMAYSFNLDAYKRLDLNDALNIWVVVNLVWDTTHGTIETDAKLKDNYKNRVNWRTAHVDTRSVKLFLDGIPHIRTAWFLDPYLPDEDGNTDQHGVSFMDSADLNRLVTQFDKDGVMVKMHAAGDASVRQALDAITAARRANDDSGVSHIVSHSELVAKQDLPRFAQINAVAELSPFLWYPNPMLDVQAEVLGKERVYGRYYPVKNLLEEKALITYGSDWLSAILTANPWPALEAMITRQDPNAETEGTVAPDQAVDLPTAIRIFTRNGARAMRIGDKTGSIEVGKSADMLILDRNLFEIPVEQISDTQVLQTLFAGRVVYTK